MLHSALLLWTQIKNRAQYINFLHTSPFSACCMLCTQFDIVFALNYILCFLSLIDWLIDWTNRYNIRAYIVRCPNESNWFWSLLSISSILSMYPVLYVSYRMNINLQNCWIFGLDFELLDCIRIMIALAKAYNLKYAHIAIHTVESVNICFQNLNYTFFLSRMAYKLDIQS